MFNPALLTLAQADGQDLVPSLPSDTNLTPSAPGDAIEGQDSSGNGAGADPGAKGEKGAPGFPPQFFILMLVIMGVFVFMSMSGQRREKKKHAKMLSALGKGNRVLTAGGIYGTVVELRDNEVLVKVDENNNTRMKFTREAIKTVLADKDE